MANIGKISINASVQNLCFKITGTDTISINFGTETKNFDLQEDIETIVEYTFSSNDAKNITIFNTAYIKNINVSNNNINTIELENCVHLKKFVAHNNNINDLDFINCDALQFVHIQNNPICTNKSKMIYMINTLTDRNNRSFGSIVMYDFVPLENYESMTEEQKSLRSLRKELENISIPKDWYFGSAILYHETENKKVNNVILDSNAIDIWESAEYGEGVVYADLYNQYVRNTTSEWSNSVFLKKYDITEQGTVIDSIQTDTNVSSYDKYHGSAVNSLLVSHGKQMYGLIPKAKIVAIQRANLSFDDITWYSSSNVFNKLMELENLDFVLSTTTIYDKLVPELDKEKYSKSVKDVIDKYKLMYFVSSSNNGDRNEETEDPGVFAPYAKLVSGCILNIDVEQSNIGAENPNINDPRIKFTNNYYYNEILNNDKYTRDSFGTSYSAPVTSGVYALLRILYKKKYKTITDLAHFENYIYSHCKPLHYNVMHNTGYGKLNSVYYNDISNNTEIESVSKLSDINLYENNNLNNVLSIQPQNTSNCNFHLPYKLGQDIIIDNNTIYPLKNDGSTVVKKLYSDSNSTKAVDLNITFPDNKKYEEVIDGLTFSLTGTELKNEVSGENLLKSGDIVFNKNSFKFTGNGYLDFDKLKFKDELTLQICVSNVKTSNKNQNLFTCFKKEKTSCNFSSVVMSSSSFNEVAVSFTYKNGQLFFRTSGELFDPNTDYMKVFTFAINIPKRTIKTYVNGIIHSQSILMGNLEDVSSSSGTKYAGYEDLKQYNTMDTLRIGNNASGSAGAIEPNFYAVRVFDRELSVKEIIKNTSALIMNANYKQNEGGDNMDLDYKGSVTLISGLTQANNGKFPLVDGSAVQFGKETNKDGTFKSVSQKIDELLKEDKSDFATSEDIQGIINDLFG